MWIPRGPLFTRLFTLFFTRFFIWFFIWFLLKHGFYIVFHIVSRHSKKIFDCTPTEDPRSIPNVLLLPYKCGFKSRHSSKKIFD